MNYEEALKFINEIPWTSRSVGLHRIKELLDKLGRPDKNLKFIHVAGTNGKGSVCAMMAKVLEAEGYKTGLFTSPHLIKYNERMKINGEEISDAEMARVITKVANVSKKMEEDPSEFEILTAAALLWFKEKKCQIVVLEVGLGGEFDSTNAIENKELAVITPIGFDHTAILGRTLKEITSAKAGIIIRDSDVVCSLQNREGLIGNDYPLKEVVMSKMQILNTISEKCRENNVKLYIPDIVGFRLLEKSIDGQVFKSRYYKNPIRLNLIGEYQLMNALTVLESVRVLNKKGYHISEDAVRRGLDSVEWAARFEILNRDPVFILDGAHNDHGIDAAVDALRWLFGDRKITYILGILSDKNIEEMLLKLYSNAKRFITLTPESERAFAGEKLAKRLRESGFEADNFDTAKEAVNFALQKSAESGRNDEVICSLGSLYLAGSVRDCFVHES